MGQGEVKKVKRIGLFTATRCSNDFSRSDLALLSDLARSNDFSRSELGEATKVATTNLRTSS